ncbi:Protein kinase domain-containing protein ppk32 [Malassezia psittaci]|uniref:Protein kinase domain-containing protein ppk32 n=1 Tax=Malassezia psittaci TaxID=1821823 RepID=A0AAF0FGC2_9BASI|nr:Protein kinase domain-containing protein ppk32 [Malassezia psittaci]
MSILTGSGRSNISIQYTIDESQKAHSIGPWKVLPATKKLSSTGDAAVISGSVRNKVSVWSCSLSLRGEQRTRCVEQLKREITTLSRLRHPCILEVVEPLEETRGELTFATEPISTSLANSLSSQSNPEYQLDEVEIRKGLLQVARSLEFLHNSRRIHTNLNPHSIIINAKADWKLAGVGYLTVLSDEHGADSEWVLEDEENRLPPQMQRDMNYVDPMYALDRRASTSNDMFSLGVLIYAIFNRGKPPYETHQSRSSVKVNADRLPAPLHTGAWNSLGGDVQAILSCLVTRSGENRPTAKTFQSLAYFNSVLVSVLQFLERDSFAARTRQEKVQFLRGLQKMLPQFSPPLRKRKLLPSVSDLLMQMIEIMSDRSLLPYILPNVFAMTGQISSLEFGNSILPQIKSLFTVQDPPQNQNLFVSKMSAAQFREDVMPLFYSAFENENIAVQENALQKIPKLSDVLEFSHVKDVLLPKLAALFAKTKILSVKVSSLICFYSLTPMLDKATLVEAILPTLARIKTKEPAVMVAALAVYEAVAAKVDRETKATAILPRLWIMSMCPALTAKQFSRFMQVIRQLTDAIENEHLAHLRDQHEVQRHTENVVAENSSTRKSLSTTINTTNDLDFETLVGHTQSNQRSNIDLLSDQSRNSSIDMSVLLDSVPQNLAPVHSTAQPPPVKAPRSTGMSTSAVGIPPSTLHSLSPPPSRPTLRHSQSRTEGMGMAQSSGLFDALMNNAQSSDTTWSASSMQSPTNTTFAPKLASNTAAIPPPGWGGGLLEPDRPRHTQSTTNLPTKSTWSDFDPLK